MFCSLASYPTFLGGRECQGYGVEERSSQSHSKHQVTYSQNLPIYKPSPVRISCTLRLQTALTVQTVLREDVSDLCQEQEYKPTVSVERLDSDIIYVSIYTQSTLNQYAFFVGGGGHRMLGLRLYILIHNQLSYATLMFYPIKCSSNETGQPRNTPKDDNGVANQCSF